jgi:hypothetical protein
MESDERHSQRLNQVKSLSPHRRFVIGLHSPVKVTETGLRMCRPEKGQQIDPFDSEQSVLFSPLCGRNIAKYGHVLRISWQSRGQILCSLDLLAEGVGFEPSVQLSSAQPLRENRKSSRGSQSLRFLIANNSTTGFAKSDLASGPGENARYYGLLMFSAVLSAWISLETSQNTGSFVCFFGGSTNFLSVETEW